MGRTKHSAQISQGCCLAFVENEKQILQMIGPLVVFKEVKRKKYRRGHRFARKAGRREQTDGLD